MLRRLFLLFIFFATPIFAEDTLLPLRGYLGSELMDGAAKKLDSDEVGERIVLQIDSSVGDLVEVLSFAKKIYDLKMQTGKPVATFIQGRAVGPAAILPFLADEIITTPLVAWGDIPYGVRGQMSPEQMAAAVRPLIDQKGKSSSTLDKLVDAMVDPHYLLVQGRIEKENKRQFDPLILNLKGMESLELVSRVMSDEDFAREFHVERSTEGAREELSKYIKYSETETNLIGYLHIGNERAIDQSTYIYIKFALKDFIERGVSFVVLNLNTPGGEVLSTLKIVDLFQKLDVHHHIPIVAFIDDWAISAGAMLAYSCRFIGATKGSIMGAAEPVMQGGQGEMVSASEKVNSALRAQMGSLASFYGRNPLIAEAMVDKDMIIVFRDHQVALLQNSDEIRGSDRVISNAGKLLTLKGEEMIDLGVADFKVPFVATEAITEMELKAGEWPARKSLVFEEPFLAQIPNAVMIDYQDWRVGFFSFLSHPAVASLLFIGLVIGLYIEINSPGFGVFGSIALGCLALILLSSFASHAVNWIEIIILCIGLVLLALELFVIPGFGVAGILGIILTIIGLFALMLPGIGNINFFEPETFRLFGMAFIERLAWLCGGLFFAILVIIFLARFFSHSYFRFSKLVLKGEQEGYVSGIPRGEMPDVGTIGESVSPLRPSGKVRIGENLYDGMTQGGFLETNTPVEVVRIEGSKVVVKRLKDLS